MDEAMTDEVQVPHSHTYRADLSDWWCNDCETVTDFCQRLNAF